MADFYSTKVLSLGEDPLREDARPEVAWSKIKASKKPIGLLLMDQSVIAGVGNIYRAEILFKSEMHPEQPGHTLTRGQFDTVWCHSVHLLQRGFQTGSILTVDPEEASMLGAPWTRRYIYNQSKCGRCRGKILTWDMAGRTVYCCGGSCQPLAKKESEAAEENVVELTYGRKKAMKAARGAVQFVSHCAPDDVTDEAIPLAKLTLAALRARAAAAGVATAGKKADLIARMLTAGAAHAHFVVNAPTASSRVQHDEPTAVPTPLPRSRKAKTSRRCRDGVQLGDDISAADLSPEVYDWGDYDGFAAKVRPGTTEVIGRGERIATAAEAAQEKMRAGEGRNVEHVALYDAVKNPVRGKRQRRGLNVD